MPTIHSPMPRAWSVAATVHPTAPTTRTIAKSPRVFMMTSSIVTRPVCTAPAEGWSYICWSCWGSSVPPGTGWGPACRPGVVNPA